MAHQLGGFYNLPHGAYNAILLPHVQVFNSKKVGDRLQDVDKALGFETVISVIQELSSSIGILSGLKELGLDEKDLEILAENAL